MLIDEGTFTIINSKSHDLRHEKTIELPLLRLLIYPKIST